jgi:hypothetical protein
MTDDPTQDRLERIRQRLPDIWRMGAELEQPDPPEREDDDDEGIDHCEVTP